MSFIIHRIHKRYSIFCKDSQINQFKELNKSSMTNSRNFMSLQDLDIPKVVTKPIKIEKFESHSSANVTVEAQDMKGQTNLESETISSVKANANPEFLFGNVKLVSTFGSSTNLNSNTTILRNLWTFSCLSSQKILIQNKKFS